MTDWGAVYDDNIAALTALTEQLDEDALATAVPATPGWTVREVIAHLAGTPADAAAGRMDGAPGDGWTQRHVAERAERTTAELLAEIRATRDDVVADLDPQTPAIVWNLPVHLADLHEALGLPAPAPRTWLPLVDALRGQVPEALADAGDYELFRALFSRRSQTQLTSMADGDAAAVAEVGIFGPREDDQPLPPD